MANETQLFSNQWLTTLFDQRLQEMIDEINALDPDYLLNVDPSSLCESLVQKYQLEVPELNENDVTVSQQETRKNRGSYQELGTEYGFHVPFEGDRELFFYRPTNHSSSSPHAEVTHTDLIFTIFRVYPGHDTGQRESRRIRAAFDKELERVKWYLQRISNDASRFSPTLRTKAQDQIEFRRKKLLNDRGTSTSLGFPLRKREDAAQTHVVPTVRRKIPPLPSASTAHSEPEPVLDMQYYDQILSVMRNMVLVMERSPTAFQDMGEEHLREHFLVQLNGQYEGQATGETFNFEGKTDILIRHNGKNLFIAECKFWKGPKAFLETINQILGYTSWRDTKTAIVLFNRNKDFSAVLAKIPETSHSHPNFKKEHPIKSETEFRYTFTHRDDPNRELILTIMAFDVPRPSDDTE